MKEKYAVYDIETISNLSTFCFLDYAEGHRKQFVIHSSKNQFEQLHTFISGLSKANYYFVGFNNLAFDSQVIEFILVNYPSLRRLSGEQIARAIYRKAQEVISVPENQRHLHVIPEWKLSTKQLDVYKQKHYDGKAKRTSLKWLEFTMRLSNIEEMPIPHDVEVNEKQIAEILAYNWNDVEATHEFFKRIKYETELRLELSKQFRLPLLNASEPRMAREILASELAKDMGISVKDLKEMRTPRKEIHLGKCIIPRVKFEEQVFKDLYSTFKGKTVAPDENGSIKSSDKDLIKFRYKGADLVYGLGGVHGATHSGVYSSDETHVIKTVDVKSFYPNMIINYGFTPAHLGHTFANKYKWFYTERTKYDKKNPINYIFKIILNSTYGLSNDKNSFIYDSLVTMQTTINGQLLLSMLAEKLTQINDSQLLMMNTDGLEIRIPRTAEEEFGSICKEWESLTQLELEGDEYDRMIIGDVNNYIAVYTERACKSKEQFISLKSDEPNFIYREDGECYFYQPVKAKGRFEINLDYHKNPSGLIIPKAVYHYFTRGIPVDESVVACDNIFDFCYGVKKKGDFELHLHKAVNDQIEIQPQQRVCRYYIGTDGGMLLKKYKATQKLPFGKTVSVATGAVSCNDLNNNYEVPSNLDRTHYIDEALKLVYSITRSSNQLSLFD